MVCKANALPDVLLLHDSDVVFVTSFCGAGVQTQDLSIKS